MNNQARRAHLIGSGIGSLASAAYLIKDGGFSGANITIYEEDSLPGGALDAAGWTLATPSAEEFRDA